jgi:hypothetical protein
MVVVNVEVEVEVVEDVGIEDVKAVESGTADVVVGIVEAGVGAAVGGTGVTSGVGAAGEVAVSTTESRFRSVLLEPVEHDDINAITNRKTPDILSRIDSPRCCSSPTIY